MNDITQRPSGSTNVKDRLRSFGRSAFADALERFARELGFDDPQWLKVFRDSACEHYDELAGLKDRRGFEAAHGLTASRISLVHEHDLEFSLELTQLAKRVRELCETELPKVHLRYMGLLEQTDAAPEQCPVGPEAACATLRDLADVAGFEPEQRLRLLERCAEPLAMHLLELYRTLNQRFESEGIGAKAPVRRHEPYRPGGATGLAPTEATVPVGVPTLPAGGFSDPLAALQDDLLLRRGRPAAAGGASLDPGLSAAILERVRTWLSESQGVTGEAAAPRLAGSELAPLLPPRTAAAVEAIERVFEAISRTDALPHTIRAILARLQVPFLRLALVDDALLADGDHPARQLIDRIAAIGATLRPDVSLDLPLCKGLDDVVRGLQRGDASGREAFERALAMLDLLDHERARRIAGLTVDATEAAGRAERRESSLVLASSALYALMDNTTPMAIRNFLSRWWIQLLARTVYSYGNRHPVWRQVLEVADRLVRSGRMPEDAAERSQWIAGLAPLIKSLNQGLGALGLGESQRHEALGPCMDLHGALLSGRSPAEVAAEPPALPEWSEVRGTKPLQVLHHSGLAPVSVGGETLAQAERGDWLEMPMQDGSMLRAVVAAVGPAGRVLLLASPEEGVTLGVTRRALADLSARKRARRIDRSSLITRLAEHALRRMHA